MVKIQNKHILLKILKQSRKQKQWNDFFDPHWWQISVCNPNSKKSGVHWKIQTQSKLAAESWLFIYVFSMIQQFRILGGISQMEHLA